MRFPALSLPILLLSTLCSTAAFADTYLVQGSGASGTFSFPVDPSLCYAAKPYCQLSAVPLTENGVEQTTDFIFLGASADYPDYVSPLDIVTSTNWYLGGYLVPAPQPGPSFYEVVPLTLTPGTYDMTASDVGAGTLTVSETPEPGTLGLLSTGVLGGWAAIRRRVLRPQQLRRT